MPLDYTTLTDRAQCDAAIVELDFELRTFSVRDASSDLADERAERSQSTTTSQLAVVNAKIATAEAILAASGIDDATREKHTDDREALLVQRRKLEKRARQGTGVKEFLADVDAEQNAAQVALLTTIKNGIASHRASLPA